MISVVELDPGVFSEKQWKEYHSLRLHLSAAMEVPCAPVPGDFREAAESAIRTNGYSFLIFCKQKKMIGI